MALALRRAISAFTSRLTCLSTLVWRPFAMSLEAMALALTGQGWVFFCATGETVERLPCNTARVTEVDVLCAGLPSIATFLVEVVVQLLALIVPRMGSRQLGIPGEWSSSRRPGSRNTTHCTQSPGQKQDWAAGWQLSSDDL